MESAKGKRLLVLGGTAASLDIVRIAKEMGIYVIVTDDNPVPGVAKQIADEIGLVNTTILTHSRTGKAKAGRRYFLRTQ